MQRTDGKHLDGHKAQEVMSKCILKGGKFADKEVEVSGYRSFIEVVRDTSELKENPIPVNFEGGGYTVVWYDFVGCLDGAGIFNCRGE